MAAANPVGAPGATAGVGDGTGGGGVVYVTSTPPDPNTAQSIAYNMLSSFGFSPATYFGCLVDLWNRESGWSYDAENPSSGAYGIAQFINGPSEYSEYGGNADTIAGQVEAMGNYIEQRYGTPSAALAHENSSHWY